MILLIVALFNFGMMIAQDPKEEANENIIYVRADAREGGDGASWETALSSLQKAIDQIGVFEEIWVAQGKYYPIREVGGTGDRYKTFPLINGLKIYGGFKGDETRRDQRDWKQYETILSGDLGKNDQGFENNDENALHVITGNNTDSTAALDGFVIEGGNANRDSWPHDGGGGMTNFRSSPTIKNCTFRQNAAFADGGGVRNWAGSLPYFFNCSFIKNKALQEGAGLMNGIKSCPTVINCTFIGNESGEDGAGIYNNAESNALVVNCLFIENSAGLTGAGIYNVNNSKPTIINCTFTKNVAKQAGGAISNLRGYPTIQNCILWHNQAPESPEIFSDDSKPVVSYSNVSGGFTGHQNTNVDPAFSTSYTLMKGSGSINAGNNEYIQGFTFDLMMNPRLVDNKVDQGAFEYAQ